MGGGLGLIPFNKNFYKGLNNLEDVKIVIIIGKNKKILKKVHDKYDNIEIIGYCDNVYKFCAHF
jgi:UDP-N-acetylglucosamine:LPS N-acetylglucosamine transferase